MATSRATARVAPTIYGEQQDAYIVVVTLAVTML
jgi:hypothetical protein